MGVSTDALLVYGFDLGGPGVGWLVHEASGDDRWAPAWCDPEHAYGVLGPAEVELRALGDQRGWPTVFGESAVRLETHGHPNFPGYLLVAHVVTAYRGTAQVIDRSELERLRFVEDWDGRLNAACETLGITPVQERPAWLLASYWDG